MVGFYYSLIRLGDTRKGSGIIRECLIVLVRFGKFFVILGKAWMVLKGSD